eukprot:GHVQ01022868.1.p1 GENE.GHVQ01022868.1~~GHVQ01022868.1.p1  ORF type:complete len:178 (+),score=37.21 GHVQ01022868.1:887-1420(+)
MTEADDILRHLAQYKELNVEAAQNRISQLRAGSSPSQDNIKEETQQEQQLADQQELTPSKDDIARAPGRDSFKKSTPSQGEKASVVPAEGESKEIIGGAAQRTKSPTDSKLVDLAGSESPALKKEVSFGPNSESGTPIDEAANPAASNTAAAPAKARPKPKPAKPQPTPPPSRISKP